MIFGNTSFRSRLKPHNEVTTPVGFGSTGVALTVTLAPPSRLSPARS